MSPQLSDHCHYPTHFPASSSHYSQQIRSTVGLILSGEHLSALPERAFMLNASLDHKYPNRFFSTLKCTVRCIVLVSPSLTRSPQGIPTLHKHCKMQITSITRLSTQSQGFIAKLRAILGIKVGQQIMKLDCYLLVQTFESTTSRFCIK